MNKIKIILLKTHHTRKTTKLHTWYSYQKLFLSFRTTTGELYARMSDNLLVHSCQLHVWHVLWAGCTFSSVLVDFQQWPEGIWQFALQTFIIPLHCLKLATSSSNSNSVLSMPPVLEATMYDSGFLVTPTSESRTGLTCFLSLLTMTSIAQLHKLGIPTSYDCERTKPVRTAPTPNRFWHYGMNRPVLNWPCDEPSTWWTDRVESTCDEPTGDETTGNLPGMVIGLSISVYLSVQGNEWLSCISVYMMIYRISVHGQ